MHFLFFLLLFFSVVSVRYNLINSIHNFSLTSTMNQNLYYLNISIMLFILGVCYKNFIRTFKNYIPGRTTKHYNIATISAYLICLLLYYTINYSCINVPIYNITYITTLKILLPIALFLFFDFFYFGVIFLFLTLWVNWLYVYILIGGTLLIYMKKNTNLISNDYNVTIHLCLLLFLMLSMLQYYVFNNNPTNYEFVSNVCLLKFNQFTKCLSMTQCIDSLHIYKILLKNNLINVKLDTITITKDSLFTSVFSKNIFVHNNLYIENANQNDTQQLFVNYILYQIFVTLSLLLFFFLVIILSKKKKRT